MDSISFDPPLPPAEQARWEHMKDVIVHLATLNTSADGKTSPFIVLFMGAVPRGSITPVANGSPPSSGHYDNDPDLLPLCGMTTRTSLIFSAAGVPTYLFKIDYDDKPAWYTTMAGNDEWNNKGQFPGSYMSTPASSSFVTDSDVIIQKFKELPEWAPFYESINIAPEGVDDSVLQSNPFFALIPHMKGEEGVVEKVNETTFAPLNKFFADNEGAKFLGGDKLSIHDCNLAYFICMANMVGLFFDGESGVKKEHTALTAYLERFMATQALRVSSNYIYVPPSLNCGKLIATLTKYGMVEREPQLTPNDLPLTCLFEHFKMNTPIDHVALAKTLSGRAEKGFTLKSEMEDNGLGKYYEGLSSNGITSFEDAKSLEDEDLKDSEIGMNNIQIKRFKRMLANLPGDPIEFPTFSPELDEAEAARFALVTDLIKSTKKKEYIIIFVGSTTPYSSDQSSTRNFSQGDRPSDWYDNDPGLQPVCSFSNLVALTAQAVGIPLILFKISYDDKPKWFTSMSGEELWNNKGSFPCVYLKTEEKGARWISDSDVIVNIFETEFQDRIEALNPTPSTLCPENIYKENVFFKSFPYIQGKDADDPFRAMCEEQYFKPLNDYLTATNHDFLDGSRMGLKDAKFAFFACMVNMLGVYFEGKSMIASQHQKVYQYLSRVMNSGPLSAANGWELVLPSTIMEKFLGALAKYGMEPRESAMSFESLPQDATHVYYEDVRGREATKVASSKIASSPAPTPSASKRDATEPTSLKAQLDAIGLSKYYSKLEANGITTEEQARTLDDNDLKDPEIGMNNLQVKRFKKMLQGLITPITTVIKEKVPITVQVGASAGVGEGRIVRKLAKAEKRKKKYEQTPKSTIPPAAINQHSRSLPATEKSAVPNLPSVFNVPLPHPREYIDFYKDYEDLPKTKLPPGRPMNIKFKVELESKSLASFQEVCGLISHLDGLTSDGSAPYIILFIGGLPRKKYPTYNSHTLHPPSPNVFQYENDPALLPICAFTALSALLYTIANYNVYYYTIDYDDKPSWYTNIDGQEKWNNKGTFPGAYVGGEWLMESETIMKYLEDNEKEKWKELDIAPASLKKEVYEENMLYKVLPHIVKTGHCCRDEVNEAFYKPLDDWLRNNKGAKFLGGDSIKLPDIKLAYMATMVNMIGLFWDGESLCRQEYTEVFAYMDRFMSTEALSKVSRFYFTEPSTNLKKLIGSLEKMGMDLRERRLNPQDVPLDAGSRYYLFRDGVKREFEEVESEEEEEEEEEVKKEVVQEESVKREFKPAPEGPAVAVRIDSPRQQQQQGSKELSSALLQAPMTPEERQARASKNLKDMRVRLSALSAFKGALAQMTRRGAKIDLRDADDDEGGDDDDGSDSTPDSTNTTSSSNSNSWFRSKKKKPSLTPTVDKSSLKSRTARSSKVNWSKNWYWMLLDSTWRELSMVVIFIYVTIALLFAGFTMPFFSEIGGTEDTELEEFEVGFVFIMTNLLSIGLGTFEPSGRATQIITVMTYFLGLIINVLMFSIVVTKFQRPQAEIVFSERSLFTSRDQIPFFVFRLGNLRGNLLYYPKVVITLQTPIKTKEGETMMKMQNVPIQTVPSTVSGSITFAHMIGEHSPLKFITSKSKFDSLGDGDLIFSVAFSAFDSTFHSDIVSSKKYFVKDLMFGKRFGDIMETKAGVNFVNWEKFNTYIDVDAKEAYRGLAVMVKRQAATAAANAFQTSGQERNAKSEMRRRSVAVKEKVVTASNGNQASPEVHSTSTINLKTAQDQDIGKDEREEEGKESSEDEMGGGLRLAPNNIEDLADSGRGVILFPVVGMTETGESLPVCTQSLSLALAFSCCKKRIKNYGLSIDHMPPWQKTVACSQLFTQDSSLKKLVSEAGGCMGKGVECEGWAEAFGKPLICKDGIYYRGIESCMEICRNMKTREFTNLLADSPHIDWLSRTYSAINSALLTFTKKGTKAEMQAGKEALSKVLKDLDGHLERYGNGGTNFLTGKDWHLIDCLLAPLLHRASCSLSYFEGAPLPGSSLNAYLTMICSSERWTKASATMDAAEASAVYMESLRIALGKNVRPKKRRQSANICI
ncbi:hypothetical protein TrVE_jg1886 [Triparma verrucosa]|uniref:GST C-terminal domain-containing protein n=1 Tax=Triparma verrucosa TaxID=1606542 RepID=A0A9W7BSP0_9STRA|nr:hypothetical protein TrVE_jg1886 [Triparma verrucosa]